jgi:ankyrin repeat protein
VLKIEFRNWLAKFVLMPIFICSVQVGAESLLVESAKNNNLLSVKALLGKGEDANSGNADGSTALHWATLRNNQEMVSLLISAGADTNSANDYGATPLWLACNNKNPRIVNQLLAAGADPNASLWSGETPLMKCAKTGDAGSVSALIKAGAYVDAAEMVQGQTALMWAAAEGHSDVVRMLIDNSADVSAKTIPTADKLPHSCAVCEWKPSPGGFTPLLFAARSGDIPTSRIFLEVGADPNEATVEHGNSLVIAAAGGHYDLALFLLQMGADPNVSDDTGLTALHHAVGAGLSLLNGVIYDGVYRIQPENNLKLAKTLLDAGADVNAQIRKEHQLGPDGTPFGMTGATPLLLAATSADVEMINLLHEFGADPSISTKDAVTPLIAAAQAACTGTCAYQEGGNIANKAAVQRAFNATKAIFELGGSNINFANSAGRTALHIAAFTGSDVVVQYLVEHGAEINAKDKRGETAWTMASGMTTNIGNRGLYGYHGSTADLLLKLGAQVVTMKELEEDTPPYAGAGL